jgi:hypothetical protein
MTNEVKSLGRPVNSESKRQQILQERELKKQNGMFKLGRPVKEDSERQKRLKELESKRENGELKRGRPVKEGSKRQQVLQMRELKVSQGIQLKRGRPKMDIITDPGFDLIELEVGE